jgi:hypothetical protein
MNTQHTPHTPGPWEVCRGLSKTHATPIRWKGENVAWVCGLDSAHEFTHEQTAANAALIASAPDLLAALQTIASGNTWDTGPDGLGTVAIDFAAARQIARAAIARATGEPVTEGGKL